MRQRYGKTSILLLSLFLLVLSACNLTSAPEQQVQLTEVSTTTPQGTGAPTGGAPTALPIGTLAIPTRAGGQSVPTSIGIRPTFSLFPTSTPTPISIVILSPIPGNVVAGNVQVLGAAIHPQFLQYQLEYGPDPNPGNLWFQATGINQNPVLSGLLGIWNTTIVQDGTYQLRLRVWLRDGTSLATVVNYIRVQNRVPTPIPTSTPNIARPIAAFTQDRAVGQAPLVIRFTNQSSGPITSYSWAFGDGGSSPDANPVYTFRNPGVYNVTLVVNGPGGSSNVSRQINVQSASAPIAAFTQDKTTGASPLAVKFTNQSTGNITSHNWIFGDGSTSTEQSPSHQFVAVGTYNVILNVTGPGGTSSVTRKITVADPVVPPPDAAFTPDVTSGNAPLTVQFANQSQGQITNYVWDFGDNTTATDANIAHTFNNPGTYTVTLTAIGPGGQDAAQAVITVNQPPNAPVAAFTQDTQSGDVPLNVSFSDQSQGQITSYSWEFGDGGTSAEQNPTHTFGAAGTYTVRLTVTGAGGTSITEGTVTATDPIAPPIAAFTQDNDAGTAPLTVQFTNQSTGEGLTHSWDFGDGSAPSNEISPLHIFNDAGNYTVTLTVTNSSGESSSASQIAVEEPSEEPVASFGAAPATGVSPLTINFDSSSSSGDITGYQWNFGDNAGTSTDANPAYTFANPGTYTVSLVVSGPGGDSAPFTTDIVVTEPAAAPVASFAANPTTGTAPLAVTFDSSSSNGDITGYQWNFGDNVGTSTDANPAYTFTNPGTYTVSLIVSGPGGDSAPFTADIVVAEPAAAPVASFAANPTTGTAPLAVTFDSSTSSGDITGYQWNFGDNVGTSSDANPAYTFANPGTYTVSLVVSGPGGDSAPFTADIIVTEPAAAPVASFAATPTTGTAPLAVTFDSSTSSGDITGYQWNFGDNVGTSTDANPAYTFANPGTYTVSLVVSGPGGDSSPFTTDIVVTEPAAAPVASFAATPTTGTAPLAVTFDSSSSSGDITGYQWNFGDNAGTSTDANPAYTFAAAGTFTVSLVVSGPGGDSSPFTTDIVVTEPAAAPVASFTADQTNGPSPLTVNFDSSTSTGDITSYQWNFGDNVGTSTDANPSYTFTNPGTYTVSLIASGPGGDSAPFTTDIVVDIAEIVPTPPPINNPVLFVSDRDGNNEIYLLETDGTLTNLTNNGASDSEPAWSPDGNKIVFVSNRDGNAELYTINADGSEPTNISNSPTSEDTAPAWSPDGNKIVFVSNRDGNAELYTINADGSEPTNLSNSPTSEDTAPASSPDGNKIVFVSNRDGNAELYTINADGSEPTNLSNSPTSDDSAPAWSKDNTQIAFVSNREGSFNVFAMATDGSNPVNVTANPSNNSQPVWKP